MVYSVTGKPLPSLIASTSTTLPDIVKFGFGKIFFRKPRGLSHNPIPWLTFSVFLCLSRTRWSPEIPPYLPMSFSIDSITFTQAIISEIFSHLFADSLSFSGIPILGKKDLSQASTKPFHCQNLLRFSGSSLPAQFLMELKNGFYKTR